MKNWDDQWRLDDDEGGMKNWDDQWMMMTLYHTQCMQGYHANKLKKFKNYVMPVDNKHKYPKQTFTKVYEI